MASGSTTTLITGASAGIGYELAKIFATAGHRLVLVSRDSTRLQALAAELTRRYGIAAEVIPKDLSIQGAAEALFAELERRGITLDILVNNAGFGTYGPFSQTDATELDRMLELNVVTLARLIRLALPGMVARRSGKILNVASTAAFQPGPLMAGYYASKAYVLSLSEALHSELQGTGVTVTVLCPGPTRTEFQQRAGIEHTRLMQGRVMDAASVARAGYRGLMGGKRLVVPGARNKLLTVVVRLSPRALVLRVVRGIQENRRPVGLGGKR